MSDTQDATPPQAFVGGEEEEKPLFNQAYPRKLREQERELIRARRAAPGVELPDSARMVGCGLSGGGIRSATFSLGLFQGLAWRGGLLKRLDFLSTVSGGGYFGSFLGRLFGRQYIERHSHVEEVLKGERESKVLRILRENGRYLSPNGAGDLLLDGAVLLRNWVSIQVVLLTFLLSAFLALQVVRGWLESSPGLASWTASWARGGTIWWSPFLILPVLPFVLWAFPLGWVYWLVEPRSAKNERDGHRGAGAFPPWTGLLLVLVASAWLTVATWGLPVAWAWGILTIAAAATVVWWQIALQLKPPEEKDASGPATSADDVEAESRKDWETRRKIYYDRYLRNRLGLWLSWALVVTGVLLAVALIDSLGQTLYDKLARRNLVAWLGGIFSSWAAGAAFARRIASSFSKGPDSGRPSLPVKWIATVVALVVVLVLLVSLSAFAHGVAWSFAEPGGRRDSGPVFLGLALTFLLSIFFGQTWSFVNGSSQQALYSARLTRAYLGASNRARLDGKSVSDVLPGDDVHLAAYWPPPPAKGTPLHLINVTINETVDGQSQIQQQDRKGNGMALGPCGLSVNVQHHLLFPFGKKQEEEAAGSPLCIYPEEGFKVFQYPDLERRGGRFPGEPLPLGQWLGISGAAFSTGTGMRTSLGLSLLAGMGNVRLGRWWDSGVVRPPKEDCKLGLKIENTIARLFPVQTCLLDEFLARFPGVSRRHWYLSDGGHFENMGGYELVRRRLPMIIIVDGEQDTDFTFEGLSNLVRKARLDFGAEVKFLDEKSLEAEVDDSLLSTIGTLEQLRRDANGISRSHAALAWITYDHGEKPASRLLYVKPTLTGDEPADVLEYHKGHPDFPHEPTIDQFFDEAQWESYRRLGEHIAETLFGPAASPAGKWRPSQFADAP